MGHNIMDTALIAHMVGLVALIIGFVALYQKDDDIFFDYSILSWVMLVLYFAINSDIDSMLVSFFILFTYAYSRDNYRNFYALSSFLILTVLYFMYKIEYPHEIVQTFSFFITTIGLFCLRGIKLKLSLIVSSFIILIFSHYYNSLDSVINQIISICILLLSIILIKKRVKEQSFQSKK